MITALFGLVTFTALGWALYNVFAATMSSLNALAGAGWATFVNVDPSNTLMFLYQCLAASACAPVLGQQWVAHYSLIPLFILPGAILATIVASRIANRPTEQKAPGQAHWGTTAELKREGYIKTKEDDSVRGYFGIHKDSRKKLQLPEHIRYSHCLVIGGPGARKSTGYHKQNIIQDMRDGVNIIVFDLKYPDPRGGFFDMVTLAADEYDYDVQLMLPYDKVTHRYSLLTKATTETGARDVASMILPPGQGGDGSEFYRNNERIILTGLILAAARKENGSLKEIVDALRQGARGMSAYVKAAEDPDVADMIGTVLDGMDIDKQKGVLNGLLGKLEIFGDPDLLSFGQLSRDQRENIDLRRFANQKTILYVGVPQQKLGANGQMFLQLIKRSIDAELGEISRENAGVFPIPISYYLDEFANFGPLPDIGADFATMRSRRLSYHVTVQNMAQGAAVYGHQEWESFYRSNFQSVLIFPRYIRFGDADLFSKFAGNLTTLEQSTSDSKGGLDSRTSINTREVSRPLMSTEEMKEWPQAEGVAFLNGVAPVRVVLPRLDEPQVNGYKNPYHPDYTRIPDKLNPYEWIAERFNRLTADRRHHILTAKLEEVQARIAEKRAQDEHNARANAITAQAPAYDQRRHDDDPEPPPSPPSAPTPPTRNTPGPASAAATNGGRQEPTNARRTKAPTKRPESPPPPTPPPAPPKGAKRFNLIIGALVKARITPSALKVSKGKRLLELAFPLTPDLTAHLKPHSEVLITQSKLLVFRKGEVALTRAGLTHLADNYTAYYYRLGVKPYSRQQRAALADPEGPKVQLPLSHNAAKEALRKEIIRLTRGKHLTWRVAEGAPPLLTAPLGKVDANRLHTYGAYWKQLKLANSRDGLLRIRPSALAGLPQPALKALPPQPEPPKPKKQAQATAPADEGVASSQQESATGRRRGNDPRAAAKHLDRASTFEDAPAAEAPPQDRTNDDAQSVEDWYEAQQASYAETIPEQLDEEPQYEQPQAGTEETPPGLKPMPEDVRMPAAVIVKPGEESTADTILLADDAYRRLAVQEWLEENSAHLRGHPDATSEEAPGRTIGQYAGEQFLIPVKLAAELLAQSGVNTISDDLVRETHRIDGQVQEWIVLDPAKATSSDDLVLIGNVDGGKYPEVLRIQTALHIPLAAAMQFLKGLEIDWTRVQATMHGRTAWVKIYSTVPTPTGDSAQHPGAPPRDAKSEMAVV